MLKIKQYFCKHTFHCIAEHGGSRQNLWQCPKCKVYLIQHWGIGAHYKSKTPHIDGWIYKNN
jgi:hypothetical protein